MRPTIPALRNIVHGLGGRFADCEGCVAEALQAKIGTLSLEAQEKLEKDTAKKEAKAEAKADAALKKKMVRSVDTQGQCTYKNTADCRHAGSTEV